MKADEAVAVSDTLDELAEGVRYLTIEQRDTLRAAAIWIRSTANQYLELQHAYNRLQGLFDPGPTDLYAPTAGEGVRAEGGGRASAIPGSLAEDTSRFWVQGNRREA